MVPLSPGRLDLAKLVVEASGAPMFLLDNGGHVTAWNQEMTRLTGMTADDVLGTEFVSTIAGDEDRDRWISGIRSISRESPEVRIAVRCRFTSGVSAALITKCALIAGEVPNPEFVACTVLESASKGRSNFSVAVLAERTAEFRELSRFLHDTISQDLVQLSFLIEKLDRSGGAARLNRGPGDAAAMLERCCGRIRVLVAMLSIPPQGAAFYSWLEGYAVFLREETGIILELDVDPLAPDAAGAETPLPAIAMQMWLGKAIRTGSVDRIVVRLREKESGVLLELEVSHTEPGLFLSGWSALRDAAEVAGGDFNVTERDTHSNARLWLPSAQG
jgi:PAS domain S-box-containing protein